MHSFKVGDKVRVKKNMDGFTDESILDEYRVVKKHHFYKILIINRHTEDTLHFEGILFNWNAKCFEPYEVKKVKVRDLLND